jgi:hypothetical protein
MKFYDPTTKKNERTALQVNTFKTILKSYIKHNTNDTTTNVRYIFKSINLISWKRSNSDSNYSTNFVNMGFAQI